MPDQFEHGAMYDRDNPLNTTLPSLDVDSDGLINSHDLDSDNDGISDFEETGPHLSRYRAVHESQNYFLVDSNGDGRVDEMNDFDNDGVPDIISAAQNPEESDSDNDGIIDTADFDYVRYSELHYSTYETIMKPGRDADNDGIENRHDPDPNGQGRFIYNSNSLVIQDNDGDGAANWLDYDDSDSNVIFPPAIQTPVSGNQPDTGQANQGSANNGGGGSIGLPIVLLSVLYWRRKAVKPQISGHLSNSN